MSKLNDRFNEAKGWATSHVILALIAAFAAGFIVKAVL